VIAWDRWIGDDEGPVYYNKRLARLFGWTLRLHKFVRGDKPGCFHSHPAHAFRLILWGGYVEETWSPALEVGGFYNRWRPGMVGYVAPTFIHRVQRLLNGHASYSLWLHGPKAADIELHGDGWPEDFVPFGGARRVRIEKSGNEIGTDK
jgi:hypothetical protein